MEKYNLFIIDDALPILNLSKKYFESEYNVSIFESAVDCLNYLNSDGSIKPHVIICDLTMPNMNGDEFVKIIKSHESLLGTPVIMLSAVDDTATRINLLKLGVDDFVIKPFNFEELSLRIKNVFKKFVFVAK